MEKVYGRRKPQKKHFSGKIVLILFSFLVGCFTASFIDFLSIAKAISQHFASSPPVKKLAQPKKDPVKPKFEFYTLLAKDSSTLVPVHKNLQTKETAAPVIPEPSTLQQPARVLAAELKSAQSKSSSNKKTDAYLVQVAAFNRLADAEHLRASLVLTGFDVALSPVQKNNITWYRVILGPFSSQREAEKARITVAASHNMSGMIKRG